MPVMVLGGFKMGQIQQVVMFFDIFGLEIILFGASFQVIKTALDGINMAQTFSTHNT